ncbi:SulP family inorganic anion transporter [Flavobacterium sp. RSB2_4_14]|uniref:SulP family inorganic anion transporter n=1 Tax=Flavobacterium sp. RSB2_4_14 TaxID=3447665 RepID=UPI003F3DE292
MKRALKYYRIIWIKHDLPAGLSLFLIALPLCLGIALASGAPLAAGLLSGIIGGLIVAPLSGSPLAVSGPSAGLTTVVAASLLSFGDYSIFLLAVIVAGFFQIMLGILKLGVFANYFPSAVIKGMLAAIGIILISKQIPLALGYNQPDFWTSGILNLFSSDNLLNHFHDLKQHITIGAIIISLVSLFIILFFKHSFAKKWNHIPVPLIVVAAGILLNLFFENFMVSLSLDKKQLVTIPSDIFTNLTFPNFSKLFTTPQVWKDGIVFGLLATLETLLCIEAIDKLDKRNRITPVNRELVAQGVGNLISGLVGAIPMTAVVVRGSANVDAGAKTKLSAFTHGLFLLLAVLLIPFLLNKIPYASLAAILLITGYNLTKPKLYYNMWSLGLKQFLPFILTIIIILLTDLLIGVCIGLLLSIYFIIQNNFKVEYKVTKTVENGIDIFCVKLNANVTFLNKVNLRKVLDEIPEYSLLTIDGSDCDFIDYDILEIISEYHTKAHEKHIELHTINIEKVNVQALH